MHHADDQAGECDQALSKKLRHRGGELVDWVVTFAAAAYHLIRLRTLAARPA